MQAIFSSNHKTEKSFEVVRKRQAGWWIFIIENIRDCESKHERTNKTPISPLQHDWPKSAKLRSFVTEALCHKKASRSEFESAVLHKEASRRHDSIKTLAYIEDKPILFIRVRYAFRSPAKEARWFPPQSLGVTACMRFLRCLLVQSFRVTGSCLIAFFFIQNNCWQVILLFPLYISVNDSHGALMVARITEWKQLHWEFYEISSVVILSWYSHSF